jgi:hypothetical protein
LSKDTNGSGRSFRIEPREDCVKMVSMCRVHAGLIDDLD